MVAVAGDFQVPANNGGSRASTASQTCDHKCTVITLSVAIPLLSLFLVAFLLFALLQRRREKRADKSREDEKEIAMKKLGPESDVSSVITEGFGGFHAVTNLEDGAEIARDEERSRRSWRPRSLVLKTRGWWKM